jgi:ubiquinone/menaquinone biosynthesis C-methylase UbiE
MKTVEFDLIADEYYLLHCKNIAASGESPEYFARYKVMDVVNEARTRGIVAKNILDFGSGIGNSLPYFAELFPHSSITCSDVSAKGIAISRARFPGISPVYVQIGGKELPFGDGSFDLVFSACVFHHIVASEHVLWLRELKRVTRKNGMLVIFEHNPLNPLTVSTVRDCPFDKNATLILAAHLAREVIEAGWQYPNSAYRMFFPHRLAFARPVERWLKKIPLGAQYFITARR